MGLWDNGGRKVGTGGGVIVFWATLAYFSVQIAYSFVGGTIARNNFLSEREHELLRLEHEEYNRQQRELAKQLQERK